MTDGEIFDMQ